MSLSQRASAGFNENFKCWYLSLVAGAVRVSGGQSNKTALSYFPFSQRHIGIRKMS